MPESMVGTMIMEAAQSSGIAAAISGAVAASKDVPGAAKGAVMRKIMDDPAVTTAMDLAKEAAAMTKEAIGVAKSVGGAAKGVAGAVGKYTGVTGVAKGAMGAGKMAGKATIGMAKGIGSMAKGIKKMGGKGAGVTGISMSVSSLLRQSQIFTGVIGSLFQIIGGFVDVLLAPFMPILTKGMEKVAKYIPLVQEYAQKVYDWIEKEIFPFIEQWVNWLWSGVEGVWNLLEPHINTIIGWTTDLWNWAKTDLLGWVTDTAWPIIKDIFDKISAWFTSVIEDIKIAIEPVKGVLEDVWNWFKSDIGDVLSNAWAWVTDTFEPLLDLWGIFEGFFTDIWGMLSTTVTDIYDKMKETLKPIWDEAWPMLQDIGDSIMNAVKPMIGLFMAIIENIVLPIYKIMFKILMWALKKIVGWMLSLFSWVWDKIGKHVLGAVSWLLSKLPAFLEGLTDFIKRPMDYIVKWAGNMLGMVLSIMDAIATVKIFGKTPFKNMMDGLGRNKLDELVTTLKKDSAKREEAAKADTTELSLTIKSQEGTEQETFDMSDKQADIDAIMSFSQVQNTVVGAAT